MNRILFITLLLIILKSINGWRSNGDGFPNPIYNKKACNNYINGSTSVCDPDNILTKWSINKIENIIDEIHKILDDCENRYEIIMITIDKLDVIGNDSNPIKTFATSIHRNWGIGGFKCDTGLVFVLSIRSKEFYFSIGSALRRNVEPEPFLLMTLRSPPMALAMRLTKDRPRPAPP